MLMTGHLEGYTGETELASLPYNVVALPVAICQPLEDREQESCSDLLEEQRQMSLTL